MPAVIITHPDDSDIELRVTFRTINPVDWSGMSEDERAEMLLEDEFEAEVRLEAIEERMKTEDDSEDWEDNSEKWSKSRMLDAVEETVLELYVERQRTRYLNRLVSR